MSIWDQGRTPSHLNHQKPTEFDEMLRGYDGPGPEKPRLTAEQFKVAHEEALAASQEHRDRIESVNNADAFISEHKEIIDNVANAKLLFNQANTMFGEGLHTVLHFEKAYKYLRTKTDFLKLDKTVLAAQQREAARQRYADAQAEAARAANQAFNPNVDYESMPIEELRKRSEEVLQEEMQTAGERGGNGW